MTPHWKKLLRSLGFTESEANIYLVSLDGGPAPVQDIAKKAGVSRVTTYAVIESLSEKGLISWVMKGKKKLFVAESPERLVSFMETRIKDMEATLREVRGTIDELKLIQRGEKPVVKLFEGPEALKAIQDDVYRSKPKQLDEFGNLDEIQKLYDVEKDLKPHYERMRKLSPKMRFIYSTTNKSLEHTPNAQFVSLPKGKFDFYGDIVVYGNKISLSTFRGKQISVLIESKDLADTMRAMFDHLWECMPPEKK